MKVLVACEESQAVCKAFREKGHEAYSCDLFECSGNKPEWHIMGDCLEVINGNCDFITQNGEKHTITGAWDLIIAHPPCTYLSNAGARHLYPKGVINEERFRKGMQAKKFFMKIFNANCNKVCVENPIPSTIFALPKYNQVIQPYEYGHPYSKKTCLWLRNLPPLKPTSIIDKKLVISTKTAAWFNKGGKERQKNRAKTFIGIAKAMADQWG